MRVGTLLGIAVAVTACTESPVAPLRLIDQAPSLAAVKESESLTIPFNRTLFIECANDGLGEDVELSGELDITSIEHVDGNGRTHLSTTVRPSHVRGVGQVTGAKYHGTGGTYQDELYAADGELRSYTFDNKFRIIGQGPDNNLLVRFRVHQKYNENGDLTGEVIIDRSECK